MSIRFTRRLLPALLPVLMAALMVAAPLCAQQMQERRFDLVLRGITAGSVTYAAQETASTYSLAGRLQTRGLVALLKHVRYDATARGRLSRSRAVPELYSENADTGRRQSQSTMEYRDGVPQVTKYEPARAPRSTDVDPAGQGGTVDPLTALFLTLHDVAPGQECKVDLRLFDGRRSSRLVTADRVQDGDGGVTCAGEYRRIGGFSAEEMAERTSFAFTLTYAPGPDGQMQVQEVAMETIYGRGRLVRR